MMPTKVRILMTVLVVCMVVTTSSVKAQVTQSAPYTISGTGGVFVYGNDGSLDASGTAPIWGAYIGPSQIHWNPQLAAFSQGVSCLAEGACSSAFGAWSTASGYSALASGNNVWATGNYSLASGAWSSASGKYSTTLGFANTASGWGSITLGYANTASGWCSTASGYQTVAASAESFVVGHFNVGGGNSTSWVATDPLFEIGNGTSGSPSDAVLVQKNGNMTVKGVVTILPGGDIPMFDGTN